MINSKLKSTRGISLISLIITVLVLMILADVIIYNVGDNLKLGKLVEMQNDIDNLRDKVSAYYAQNGKIPANIKYTNTNHIRTAGVISDAVDTGDFLVIDLSAIENLTLNRGKDFEKVKQDPQNANSYTDLYIINEASHNVFYVKGIKLDDEIYYTDYKSDNIDTATVNLRYIENVKIPEGFYYLSGTKKDKNIIIKSNDNTQEYRWIQQDEKISEVPNDIEIATNKKEDFIKSVNSYQGYYRNTASNQVMYQGLENWSLTYDKEGIYKDKDGKTVYIPQGFSVSETPGENTIDEGLVVRDEKNNEWVWIEVPQSIYTNVESSEDYEEIEKDMQTYVNSYRNNDYADIWNEEAQHGFADANEYNNWKNNMLKSVYEKGGFYIGRYEVGTNTARTSASTIETPLMIQQGAYPYNFVTCKQAQTLAKQLTTPEEKTTSLMFGIQWDLVLKYIETKEEKTQSELKGNSTTWGNYQNATFDVVRGKYTTTPNVVNSWLTVNNKYSKPNSNVLLTTGSTNRNSVLNIFDLAGNVWEWTLEETINPNLPCTSRGCCYMDEDGSVSNHSSSNIDESSDKIGFRATLY